MGTVVSNRMTVEAFRRVLCGQMLRGKEVSHVDVSGKGSLPSEARGYYTEMSPERSCRGQERDAYRALQLLWVFFWVVRSHWRALNRQSSLNNNL